MGALRRRRVAGVAAVAGALALLAPAGRADHAPLGAIEPNDEEQACIYELNLARFDPPAYGVRNGIDLSAVAPQPPLAVNKNLTGSARFHSVEMLEHNYYGHTSAVTGDAANRMAVQNGYDLFGNGLDPTVWTQSVNTIESIAKGIKLIPAFTKALALLIEDAGVGGLGHRVHLLAMSPQFQAHREIGAGRAAAGTTYLYTLHTAYRSASDTFITDVAFARASCRSPCWLPFGARQGDSWTV